MGKNTMLRKNVNLSKAQINQNYIELHEREFNLKIYWNYFATSHGKGCIDGVGATVKMVVKNQILSRKCVINCAADFVDAFKLINSKISIEEVTENDFLDINDIFNAPSVFNNAKKTRDISSAHQIQVKHNTITSFFYFT